MKRLSRWSKTDRRLLVFPCCSRSSARVAEHQLIVFRCTVGPSGKEKCESTYSLLLRRSIADAPCAVCFHLYMRMGGRRKRRNTFTEESRQMGRILHLHAFINVFTFLYWLKGEDGVAAVSSVTNQRVDWRGQYSFQSTLSSLGISTAY